MWQQKGGSVFGIGYNRYDAQLAEWGNAHWIERPNAVAPQVAVDASGDAVAVWQQPDGFANSIESNPYTQGVGWVCLLRTPSMAQLLMFLRLGSRCAVYGQPGTRLCSS